MDTFILSKDPAKPVEVSWSVLEAVPESDYISRTDYYTPYLSGLAEDRAREVAAALNAKAAADRDAEMRR